MPPIGYAQALARDRPARPGRRGARAGRRSQSAAMIGRARRLWPRARRYRQLQAGARRARPGAHARTSRTGASCRCKARCSTRWDATKKRSAITRPRCGSCPTSRRVMSNLGLSYALSKDLAQAEVDAAPGHRRNRGSIRGCGRISRWWSACRAASRKPRRSRRPTCRPKSAAGQCRLSAQMLASEQEAACKPGRQRRTSALRAPGGDMQFTGFREACIRRHFLPAAMRR